MLLLFSPCFLVMLSDTGMQSMEVQARCVVMAVSRGWEARLHPAVGSGRGSAETHNF